jgi:hypothetical protein
MFTDIVGFSRQMGSNEARTLQLLDVHNQIIQQAVAVYHGTVIKTVGDAFLVDFPAEARGAVAERMRLNPKFSLEAFAAFWPMKDPEVVEQTLAALRKAGMK